jgi:hypothetical protein
MQAQADGFEVCGAGLSPGAGALDGAADPSPDVGLVGGVEGDDEVILGDAGGKGPTEGLGAGFARAGSPRRNRQHGEIARARESDGGASLAELRFCRLQRLVRDGHLFFESIECVVAEHLPPFATNGGVAGLRLMPIGVFLVRGGNGGGGSLVVRADGAGGQKDEGTERGSREGTRKAGA